MKTAYKVQSSGVPDNKTFLQVDTNVGDMDAGLIFEQDPVQIIDALLPLYLNSTLLRSLQVRPSQWPCMTNHDSSIGAKRMLPTRGDLRCPVTGVRCTAT